MDPYSCELRLFIQNLPLGRNIIREEGGCADDISGWGLMNPLPP